jgi:hypothetical protein
MRRQEALEASQTPSASSSSRSSGRRKFTDSVSAWTSMPGNSEEKPQASVSKAAQAAKVRMPCGARAKMQRRDGSSAAVRTICAGKYAAKWPQSARRRSGVGQAPVVRARAPGPALIHNSHAAAGHRVVGCASIAAVRARDQMGMSR